MEETGYYEVRLVEELHPGAEPTWYAEHPDLPGCHAVGTTPDEATANLDKSREAWLKWAQDHDVPIPPPEESPSIWVQYAAQRNVARTKATLGDVADQLVDRINVKS